MLRGVGREDALQPVHEGWTEAAWMRPFWLENTIGTLHSPFFNGSFYDSILLDEDRTPT